MVTVDIPSWHANAKCAGAKPGSYDFPKRAGYGTRKERAAWKRYVRDACEGCPVIGECAQDAIERPWFTLQVIRAGACWTGGPGKRSECKKHWQKVVKQNGLG